MRIQMLAALLAVSMIGQPSLADPASVSAAVSSTGERNADNVKLDAGRKPAELLAFLGLEKGMKVADMFGGNLYWSEIIAPSVGPYGQVTLWQPTQFINDKRRATLSEFATKHPNLLWLTTPFQNPRIGVDQYDFMIINLDYHDVYWSSEERKIPAMNPDEWLKTIYAAMKPGGIVGVIDHVAAPGGDTRKVVDDLHRIDPEVVKADWLRAGFVLEGESDMLHNPADAHTANVFDPSIRGKTDRFIFKFRKPQ